MGTIEKNNRNNRKEQYPIVLRIIGTIDALYLRTIRKCGIIGMNLIDREEQ